MESSNTGPSAQSGGPGNANRGRGDGQGRTRGRGRGRGGQNAPRGGRSQRGGGRGRDSGPGRSAAGPSLQHDTAGPVITLTPASVPTSRPGIGNANDEDDDVEAEVCFICASPVVHQSVAPCNHRTCHICALRMRALYKNKECAHCRTVAPYVIFTDDSTKHFEDYSVGEPDITSTDENIGIRYANEDIVGDTVLLLRYNCPDNGCDFAGLSWPDLHRHVRSVHHKKMCDLCTRSKKVFTHEHELFTDKELEKHMRHGDDRPGTIDQTGFKGHPLCAFCGQRFYDDDKLYEHCRNKHERCFLCDRQDPRQPHYYLDYNALEKHFGKDHYPCLDRECQEKKFVVFASELDLKAHQLSEHGNTLSKDVRRDARLVDMAGFDFRQPYQQERRVGGSGRQRDREREGRGRGRDPNAEPIPSSSAQPMRRDELAFQRQMAIHSSQSVSNRTFGGQLSSAAPGPSSSSSTAISQPPTQPAQRNASNMTSGTSAPTSEMEGLRMTDPNLTPEERARLVRHAAVIERASNLLQNDSGKIANFRSYISSYRQGKIPAATLIDSFFSLFSETSTNALGTLVREVAELFEDKSRAEQLRKAWNDWRAINEDYPVLPSLSGMHGATTSNSGWAAAAAAASSPVATAAAPSQRHTTRVLKLKNSTQQSQRSSAQQSSDWSVASRPTRPPPPTAAFPALPSGNVSSTNASQASPANSLWGTGGSSRAPTRSISKASSRDDSFPALPSAPRPTTTIFGYGRGAVRRDLGGPRNTGFSWGGTGDDTVTPAEDSTQAADNADGGKGKKKGNKGRKQVLVQWG